MREEPERGEFWEGELEPVVDDTLVEHLDGPNDGEFRQADENGARPNGMYVPVSEQDERGEWRIVAKQYLPR